MQKRHIYICDLSLIFTYKEAQWLRGFIQNHVCPEAETLEEREMRVELFNALENFISTYVQCALNSPSNATNAEPNT